VARFVSQLGFRPTDRVRKATHRLAASILDISRERWLMELNKLLLGQHVMAAFSFLQQTRVLGFILPELAATVGFDQTSEYHHKDVWQHTLLVVSQTPPRLTVRWAALLHDVGKVWTREFGPGGKVHFFRHEDMSAMLTEAIASRFRFSNTMRQDVRFLVKEHLRANLYDGSWTESAVRRFNREIGPYLPDLLDLSRADVTSANPARRQKALDMVEELARRSQAIAEKDSQEPVLPKGLGRLIMDRFGIEPGRRVGELRDQVEDAMLRGVLEPDASPEAMLDYLASLDAQTVPASEPDPGQPASAPDSGADDEGWEDGPPDERGPGPEEEGCEA
jgi:poly(A) polymerase